MAAIFQTTPTIPVDATTAQCCGRHRGWEVGTSCNWETTEPQEVVLGKPESADGVFGINPGAPPMPIVAMELGGQLVAPLA